MAASRATRVSARSRSLLGSALVTRTERSSPGAVPSRAPTPTTESSSVGGSWWRRDAALARAARPDPARRDRRDHPLRRQHPGPAQLRQLTAGLQGAARAGGRPPLLISTDQEGGSVRRLPWAGPAGERVELGATSAASIRREALLAGRACGRAASTSIWRPSRTCRRPDRSWRRTTGRSVPRRRSSPARYRILARARDAEVSASVKHCPGIGRATRNTDRPPSRFARVAAPSSPASRRSGRRSPPARRW